MKKAIVGMCACLMALGASADTLATSMSKGGNTINLNDTTSKMCTAKGDSWNYAESVDTDGLVQLRGCWNVFGDVVKIDWGTFEANWSVRAFVLTAQGQRVVGGASRSKGQPL